MNVDPETKAKFYSAGQAEFVAENILNNYENGEMIILVGHSAGGGDVQDISKILKDKGIANVLTVQIDSVEPIGDDAMIPSNVVRGINVYEDYAPWYITGESNIYAEDVKKTEIINQEFKHEFAGPAPKENNPNAPHQNIDNDPIVQKFIIEKILEREYKK